MSVQLHASSYNLFTRFIQHVDGSTVTSNLRYCTTRQHGARSAHILLRVLIDHRLKQLVELLLGCVKELLGNVLDFNVLDFHVLLLLLNRLELELCLELL